MTEVTVVVPTRDRAGSLRRTLLSAEGQRGVDREIVVVDDGSRDAEATLAATAGIDGVRFLRNDAPTGVSASRNRGIEAARGRWIAFLDDDDLWSPEKLALQLRAADEAGAAWVYAGDVNVDTELRVLSGNPAPDPDTVMAELPRFNPISSGGSNVVVRREVLADVGGFDPTLRRTEDWDLWIRLARVGRPAWVPRPLVAYVFHPANASATVQEMIDEPRVVAARHAIPVDMTRMYRRAAWVSLRAGRRWLAARHYLAAVVRGDARSLARAAVALVHPDAGTDRLFGLLPRDDAWTREAESWLSEIARTAVDRQPSR